MYILAASSETDITADFTVGGSTHPLTIQDWAEKIGQWDRSWGGTSAYAKRNPVAWYCTHKNIQTPAGQPSQFDTYQYSFLFKYTIPLTTQGPTSVVMPDDSRIRVFAMTLADNANDAVCPMTPAFPVLPDGLQAVTVAGSDSESPSIPTGVTEMSVTDQQVRLSWTASSDDVGVAGYRVYRNGVPEGMVPVTAYTDTGLSADTSYSYTVEAIDGAENSSGQSTPPLTVTTGPLDTQPPSAPGNLHSLGKGQVYVSLAWTGATDNYGVEAYRVVRDGSVVGTTAATSYVDWGLTGSSSYQYVVEAVDGRGLTTASAPLSVTTDALPGLLGEYYDDMYLSVPAVTRVDEMIDFHWGQGAPDASMDVDTYSVRLTGQVQPEYSETYTFYTTTDDGVRLWVNGIKLIDEWHEQGATEYNGTIALAAGQWYEITMEYFENGGDAVAQLSWSSDSRSTQVIPSSRLYPDTAQADPCGPSVPEITDVILLPGEVVLAWNPSTDNYGVSGYRVLRDGVQLGMTTETSYTDTTVAPCEMYTYTVVAYDSSNNTSESTTTVTTDAAPQDADYDNDGDIDLDDLVLMAGDWLSPAECPAADINADSAVNLFDYEALVSSWNPDLLADNLLANGLFEDGASGSLPDHWGGNGTYGQWDDTVGYAGSCSLKVIPGGTYFNQTVSANGLKTYTLGGWMKLDSGAGGSLWIRAAGPFPGSVDTSAVSSTDWSYAEVLVDQSVSEYRVDCVSGGMSSGTGWFDDLQLVENE